MPYYIEINGVKTEVNYITVTRTYTIKDTRIENLENTDWGDLKDKIKEINFRNCEIISISGLNQLENLYKLSFRECIIHGNLEISNIASLRNFGLVDVIIKDESALLLKNSNVNSITIYRTKGFSDMKFLGDLPSLMNLDIKHTHLEHIRNLEKTKLLTYLLLDDNLITNFGELELIIKQNPNLKKVTLLQNPIIEAQDMEEVLVWDRSGSIYSYKNLHPTLRLTLPKIEAPPKPKPEPKPYVISDQPINCRYCKKNIPPLMDFLLKHNKKYSRLRSAFARRNLSREVKGVLHRQLSGRYVHETYRYFKAKPALFTYPEAKGPICEKCSGKFLREMEKILPKMKTKGDKMALRKSEATVQERLNKMKKKWGSEYLGFGDR